MGVNDIRSSLSRTVLAGTYLDENCPKEGVTCQPQKYRDPSAHCNNVQNPEWGNAYTSYGRLLPPSYADGMHFPFSLTWLLASNLVVYFCLGISQTRMAISGKPLPNPVKVADAVHAPKSKPSHGYLTTLAAVWAQFVLHDISYPITFAGI